MLASIRTRILATCVAIVMAALAITGVINYFVARAYNERSIDQNLAAVSAGQARAISDWLAAKSAIMSSVSSAQLDGDPAVFLPQMKQSGNFAAFYVGFPDKRLLSSSRLGKTVPLPTTDPTTRPFYQRALEAGKLSLTRPYLTELSRRLVITFSRPIFENGALKCVIAADVPLDVISATVNEIHPTPASFAFVVDDRGVIIAHPDAGLNLKSVAALSPSLTTEAIDRLSDGAKPMAIEIGGARKLVQVRAIDGTGWRLVIALDESEAMAGLHALAATEWSSLVIVASIAALLIAALTARPFKRLSQVRDAMQQIGSGNGAPSVRLPATGNDEVAAIARSFNLFVDKMNVVLVQIRDSSGAVKDVAGEIAGGTQNLSARTEYAASSLQQTAASMQEIYGTVMQSAELATQASALAEAASHVAMRGGAAVDEVVLTMEAISESSKRIVDIVGMIEGIASQTNILALNAAVEAARAGAQGRGFAVVAAEVRSLAQRCTQAAKEIKQLIHDAASKVTSGARLASGAGATMHEMVDSVQRVTAIIDQITAATGEQSTGIGQVNQAVAQLDEVTQQNATLVEAHSAAAQHLEAQSVRLTVAVASLQLAEQ
ncbi:methyl-accepting chemotaxis protein [Trinickia sp.]|uniref:methyl-accepting chemotaxis protein n=1 Tax=Trinickia sp. TaxID=2571163 RepID=UPI003F7F8191